MDNLEIVYKDVSSLIPYARNSRTHSDDQITRLASSIKEFGFTNPILIDGENGIIAGHGRLQAAKKIGLAIVPTIELSGLTAAQKRAYILADNRLALDAGWDENMLSIELSELKEAGYNISLTGFQETEVDRYISGLSEESENPYTDLTDIPQYQPKGINPAIVQCFDDSKYRELCEEIECAGITDEEKEFLKKATTRHIVFNYSYIAEYYCNASKEMQQLMEKNALVIIDYNDAIKYGFADCIKSLENTPKN